MAGLRSRKSSDRLNPRRDRAIEILLVAVIAIGFLGVTAVSSATTMATPTFVQGSARVIRDGTVNTLQLQQATGAGDLIVVFAVWDNTAPMNLADSDGNSYRVAVPQMSWGSGWSAETLYAKNINGGPDSVTATYATPISAFGQIYVHEYTGIATSLVFDVSKGATGTGSAMSSGAATTQHNQDLIFGGGASNDTVTAPGSGFHTRSTAFANITEDRNVTSRGSYSATATQNSNAWVMQMTAFKAATIDSSSGGSTGAKAPNAAGQSTSTDPSSTATTMGMPSTTGTTVPMSSTTATTMPSMPDPPSSDPMSSSSSSSSSSGMGGMNITPDQCKLPQLAFCDTFQTIVGGGREGDLDPAKWSFTRASQNNNPSQGQINNYSPFNAEFCMTHQVRIPDNDSFICGQQFGESNHWMEGMDDNGQYAMNSLRARQPFDFAGRTGNVVWDVDAKTEGSHSFWNEVWLTDEPVQGPHLDHPGSHMYPRNGMMLLFDADWCGATNQTVNALREVVVFTNYQPTVYTIRSSCFSTLSDHANHFQLKISSNHIEVWASDAGGANFRQLAALDVPTLPLTRGYLSFQHAQYNAAKFNSTNTMTYHWHAIGFDGPVLPTDRGYEVPDALQKRSDGTINLGYQVPTATFSLTNVNLANVKTAYLTYDAWWFASNKAMTATINGVDRTASDPNPDAATLGGYQWRYMMQPVALSDLHNGTNTVSFKPTQCADQCPTIANVDLELVQG